MKCLFPLVIVLSLSWPAWAQGFPEFKQPLPPPARILQMRYEGFCKWTYDNAPTMNEAQADYAADYYAKARRAANNSLLAGKPALKTAMAALEGWNADYYDALYRYNGGGTLYSHSANRSVAALADVEFDAATRWKNPPKVAVDLSKALPFESKRTLPEFVEDKAGYKKATEKEKASLEKVKAAITKLPPGARAVLGGYVVELSARTWGEGQ